MKAIGWIIGIIFLAGVLVAACFATVHKDDDSLGPRVVLISHRDRGDCWDDGYDDCGGGGGDRYRQEYGNRGDQSRCRGENCRGSFSPGPFDRSPLDFRNACISLNCSGRDDGQQDRRRRDGDRPPPDEPMVRQSLFPPTPNGIKEFVLQTIQSGIELGRLFADTTITFVSNLLVGIA